MVTVTVTVTVMVTVMVTVTGNVTVTVTVMVTGMVTVTVKVTGMVTVTVTGMVTGTDHVASAAGEEAHSGLKHGLRDPRVRLRCIHDHQPVYGLDVTSLWLRFKPIMVEIQADCGLRLKPWGKNGCDSVCG